MQVPSLVPSILLEWQTTTSNSNSREYDALFWLPWASAVTCTYTCPAPIIAQLLHRFWGAELRSSCLHSKHFTQWSASLTPTLLFGTTSGHETQAGLKLTISLPVLAGCQDNNCAYYAWALLLFLYWFFILIFAITSLLITGWFTHEWGIPRSTLEFGLWPLHTRYTHIGAYMCMHVQACKSVLKHTCGCTHTHFQFQKKKQKKLGIVVHTYNPNTGSDGGAQR